MNNIIKNGKMSDTHIYIPTLWCENEFCVLRMGENETFDDLKIRYPDTFICGGYGSIESVLRMPYPNNYEVLFGNYVYIIENDCLDRSYFMVSNGDIAYMDPQEYNQGLVCLPGNLFTLRKFYIEYILPIR